MCPLYVPLLRACARWLVCLACAKERLEGLCSHAEHLDELCVFL